MSVVDSLPCVLEIDEHKLEFYSFQLYRLEKQRMKITKRGRLSALEDSRLTEIDLGLQMYTELIEKLYKRAEQYWSE